jgi:hypothetical protein
MPALGRLRQKDCKFETNLDYIVKPCLIKLKKKKKIENNLKKKKKNVS